MTESLTGIVTFLILVLHHFRVVLCAGFYGDEPWSLGCCQAPILCLLAEAYHPVWLLDLLRHLQRTFAYATHGDLLAGVSRLGSEISRV